MKTFNKSLSRSSGYSLVELLIAGLLGIILLAGVIELFLGTKSSYRMQEQLANVQTDGRFALMFIERFVENAGWTESIESSNIVQAVDFNLSVEGGAGSSDELVVQMEAPANTVVDCNGVLVATASVQNRFYMNGTTLECQGNGGAAAQPVIENVESFQVLYGIDTDSNGSVNQYVDLNQVNAISNVVKPVIAIQIALLVSTQDDTSQDIIAQTHNVLSETLNYNDRRVRRVFKQTIMVPNQAYLNAEDAIIRSFGIF